MNEDIIAEGIYVKQGKEKLGTGATTREFTLETFWLPCRVTGDCVELYPVTDNLQGILTIKEKVSLELFKKEYSLKENTRDIYLSLKKRLPR